MREAADLAAVLIENAELREQVDSLRAALGLKEAKARYRDAAKQETCMILGLPEGASIHDILSAIRGAVAERDRLRRLVGGHGE